MTYGLVSTTSSSVAAQAGCVLATRLSQDPDTRVLLLEAGAAIASAGMADPVAFFSLQGSSVDWGYQTIPQAETENAVHLWPRGKVLGGSSGINGMMHFRGDRSSYDAWEAAGATGWNYDELLPFFKRSERAVDGGDPEYRGLDGPMQVAPAPAKDPLWEAAFEAAVQAGHAVNPDSNGAAAVGTSWHESNVVDGVRQSAADGYLAPIAGRPNLTVVADAHVRRLLVKRVGCQGVEYLQHGEIHTAFADREVVLSAGTIGTPQLLLLSGIGPAQHLRDLGIEVVADLPGVGANLQDHPKSQVAYTTTRAIGNGLYARKPQVLLRSEPAVVPDLHAIFIEFPIHPRFVPGQEHGYSVIFALMKPGQPRVHPAGERRPGAGTNASIPATYRPQRHVATDSRSSCRPRDRIRRPPSPTCVTRNCFPVGRPEAPPPVTHTCAEQSPPTFIRSAHARSEPTGHQWSTLRSRFTESKTFALQTHR